MNNTIKVGDSFENKVYGLFKGEIEQNRLFVKGENSKICLTFFNWGFYFYSPIFTPIDGVSYGNWYWDRYNRN